jgi:1,4-alpha-glucan branching enzyme
VAYRVTGTDEPRQVAAFVRDPRSSEQVWNRYGGYPGDGDYLEFHKIRWPEGLRLWRVTSREHELGDKAPYDPVAATARAHVHAAHFADLLSGLHGVRPRPDGSVVVAPFDTELLGHWWFEGPDFLAGVYTQLAGQATVRPVTAGRHLDDHGTPAALPLVDGSWGRDGDYTMWMGDAVAHTWPVIWELEHRLWDSAPLALGRPGLGPVLAQAARALLLLQSSDWQFIITTGAAADYATARFEGHAADCRDLLDMIDAGLAGGDVGRGVSHAAELARRDDLFPHILTSVADTVKGYVS